MLVVGAGHGGATVGGEAVEAREHVGVELSAERIAFGLKGSRFCCEFLLAVADALAGNLESAGHALDVCAGGGERSFMLIGALEACQLLAFETIDFGLGERDLVLHGFSLRRGGNGVELRAVAGGLVAMRLDVAFEAGAQGLFARQRVREGGGELLSLVEGGFGLGDFSGERPGGLRKAGALEFDGLQLDQIGNERQHDWKEE